MRPKPDQVQTEQVVDLHPNILNKKLEVIGHVPKLMATWLTRFLKRHTSCEKVVIKGSELTEEVALDSRFHVNTFLRVTISPVSGCIGS